MVKAHAFDLHDLDDVADSFKTKTENLMPSVIVQVTNTTVIQELNKADETSPFDVVVAEAMHHAAETA